MKTLGELAHWLNAPLVGDSTTPVNGVGSATRAQKTHIAFAVDAPRAKALLSSNAGAAIVREADAALLPALPKIIHPDPYFAYAKLAQFFSPRALAKPGIHPTAFVEPSATVDPTAEIGPFVYIAPQVSIGAGVRLHAGVRVGSRATIAAETEMFPNVVVYYDCHIGVRGIIHGGVVIGADGFGFAPHAGSWTKIPQTGGVRIGDDVEIGANTTIDRGALDDTVIEDGVKLDNQIQIGHNCRIGAHTAIAGCTGIAGSTVIGKHCMIGGASMFTGHFEVCDGVIVSAGTLISSDIKTPGRYTGVFPTVEHNEWRKMAAKVRRLTTQKA